jgi:hypothetical protein
MLSLTRDSPAAALMYLSSATPNKRSLGALNGLARTVAAIQGAIGPGVADSLLRFHFGRDLCICCATHLHCGNEILIRAVYGRNT